MTIYLSRTMERRFYAPPLPAAALFWTTELIQAVATLLAVYGWFMRPIGWKLAGLVWAYALGWFLPNDLVKSGAYQHLAHRAARARKHLSRAGEVLAR
jgi:H+-transporting ATPase